MRATLSSLAVLLATPSSQEMGSCPGRWLSLGNPEPAPLPLSAAWNAWRPGAFGLDGEGFPVSTAALRILVVEDELLIRMLLEDMLAELGHTVAGQAVRVGDALEAARTGDFDLAILDVNLSGETTAPVADALAERGTPFVFATGYGTHGLPEAHRGRPTLKKPFQMDGLKQMLEAAVAGKA
jgi:CheY-like chemotaxis protein